jgi:hypothetical protein
VTGEELTTAQNTLALQRAELAEILEKEADLEGQIVSAQAEHDAAHARFRLLIATASSVLGIGEADLCAPYAIDEHLHAGIHTHEEPTSRPLAAWRRIDVIEVRAQAPGVIESLDLTNGAWASAGSLVLASIEPERLRFRAMGMQSDLPRMRDGLPARIVPPRGGAIHLQDTMEATLSIGLSADPRERTVELLAVPSRLTAWARAGVSAHLEITTAGGKPDLAIPLSCVIQDGLERIIFRRDPKNPDVVIRMKADLGIHDSHDGGNTGTRERESDVATDLGDQEGRWIHDGRWVVIRSGVREGDEVVLGGVYQLMIATSGTVEKGGHFHSDGTFHAGEDEK